MNTIQETIKKHDKTIGIIASVLAIIMFISLIEVLISNVKGESNILVQPIATSFSGFFWSLYGYNRKDWIIMTPNLIALFLGVATTISALI